MRTRTGGETFIFEFCLIAFFALSEYEGAQPRHCSKSSAVPFELRERAPAPSMRGVRLLKLETIAKGKVCA